MRGNPAMMPGNYSCKSKHERLGSYSFSDSVADESVVFRDREAILFKTSLKCGPKYASFCGATAPNTCLNRKLAELFEKIKVTMAEFHTSPTINLTE